MNDRYRYLTDEELEKLISGIEENDIVNAPAGIEEKVLAALDFRNRKIAEYRRYCIRVGFSVAAAIAILFLARFNPYMETKLLSREAVLGIGTVVSKQEFILGRETKTKEEALSARNTDTMIDRAHGFIEGQLGKFFE